MTSARCPSCGTRRARRPCPALGRDICTVCCGTKRLTDIACPDTCGYLHTSRAHPAAAAKRRDAREMLLFGTVLGGTTERQRAIFALLQTTIARYAHDAVPRLIDRDVADAAGALAATFETAARGIIYEQHATSLPAQRLGAALRAQIDAVLRPAERPLDRDLAIALRRTETIAARAAAELDGGDTAYLQFLERRVGTPQAAREPAGQTGSGLIVP